MILQICETIWLISIISVIITGLSNTIYKDEIICDKRMSMIWTRYIGIMVIASIISVFAYGLIVIWGVQL